MKVLLANPPTSLKNGWGKYLIFPLPTLCVASFIKNQGIDTRIYHEQNFNLYSFGKIIKEYKPEVIGLTCVSTNFKSCIILTKLAKAINKNICVVLGGVHATFFHEQILKRVSSVDIIVRGEGEVTFLEILKNLHNKGVKNLHKIEGITYKINKKIIINPGRPFISNLDSLPPLSYELIDISKIVHPEFDNALLFSTSRGCVYSCKFCATVGMWNRSCRFKSAEKINEEIKICKKQLGITDFWFSDPTFTINKNRVKDICQGLRKLKIKWSCQTRVDCIDKKLLHRMKEAGCVRIVYGVESFSPKVLRLMGKAYKPSQAIEVLNYTNKMGIQSLFQLLLGFPGETKDTLDETMCNMRKLNKGVVCYRGVHVYELHPGSVMYILTKKLGIVNDDAWFLGFTVDDFVAKYYSKSLLKEIYSRKKEILDLFGVEDV